METLTMSWKELDRLTIMIGIKRQELSRVQAAGLMGWATARPCARLCNNPRIG
ncbi:MAG: hypothetical protein WCV00_23895 [Verrucomicrobiia bacterium]